MVNNKWNVTVGGNSNVENGKGGAAGQLSVGYMPVQGTQNNAEVTFNDPFKVKVIHLCIKVWMIFNVLTLLSLSLDQSLP